MCVCVPNLQLLFEKCQRCAVRYFPILFRDEFWLLTKDMVLLNNATHDWAYTGINATVSGAGEYRSGAASGGHSGGAVVPWPPSSSPDDPGGSEHRVKLPAAHPNPLGGVDGGEALVLPLSLEYGTISTWKWQLMGQMEMQWAVQVRALPFMSAVHN